jgi:predicted type IV restriction endonuclease
MEESPFLTFNIYNMTPELILEVEKFHKNKYDQQSIAMTAQNLKYISEIKDIFIKWKSEPSDELIHLILNHYALGKYFKNIGPFRDRIKQAIDEFIQQEIREYEMEKHSFSASKDDNHEDGKSEHQKEHSNIETTPLEKEGFKLVRTLLTEVTDPHFVYYRDTAKYLGIIYKDNRRQQICRLYFNEEQLRIGLFSDGKERTVTIDNIRDITSHANELRETVKKFIKK